MNTENVVKEVEKEVKNELRKEEKIEKSVQEVVKEALTYIEIVDTMQKWSKNKDDYKAFVKALIVCDTFESPEKEDAHRDDVDAALEETIDLVLNSDPSELPLVNPEIIDFFFKTLYDRKQERKLNQDKGEENESN